MPTFTAVAFDRLIEPGAEKSMVTKSGEKSMATDSKLERRRSTSNYIEVRGRDAPSSVVERGYGIPPNPKLEKGVSFHPNPKLERGVNIPPPNSKLERGVSVPPNAKLDRGVSVPPNIKLERGVSVPPNAKLERGVVPSHSHANLDRRNGAPTGTAADKENHWTQISPALYATPASTPLPDSPSSSSFPPSPYIINHKRRGPRLMKSFSEDDVATCKKETVESKVDEEESRAEEGVPSGSKDDLSVPKKVLVSTEDNNIEPSGTVDVKDTHLSGVPNGKPGNSKTANGPVGQNGLLKSVNFNLPQDDVVGDSADPQDSVSAKSIENEGNGGPERSLNYAAAITEFYDAWEELSSESGPHLPLPDIESELREMRLTLLMEIEKRKQAEENLNNLQSQWQRIREQLSLVGLTLPADPTAFGEGEETFDPVADVCQQVYLARLVSNSIGRGMAKAEVEMEMEARIELKNSEIARLWDRLHYYEAVNQEMSQRNQEVVETARRLRQRRKIRRRWIWGSISAALTLGSAALVYSYLQGGKGSSSQSPSQASESDHGSK